MHVLTGICYPEPLANPDVPLPWQESPYGGRIRLEEDIAYLVINMRMPTGGEVLHEEWCGPCQMDRTKKRACAPDGDRYLLRYSAIPGRMVLAHMSAGISHEDMLLQEMPQSCLMHGLGCVSPAIPGRPTEILEYC